MALSPGQYFFAIELLMTATCTEVGLSASVKVSALVHVDSHRVKESC